MNEQFARFTTSTAFDLKLSRSMVEYLVLRSIDHTEQHRTFVSTRNAARRRGLVESERMTAQQFGYPLAPNVMGPVVIYKDRLTQEGELVVELLKSAGIYDSVLRSYGLDKVA